MFLFAPHTNSQRFAYKQADWRMTSYMCHEFKLQLPRKMNPRPLPGGRGWWTRWNPHWREECVGWRGVFVLLERLRIAVRGGEEIMKIEKPRRNAGIPWISWIHECILNSLLYTGTLTKPKGRLRKYLISIRHRPATPMFLPCFGQKSETTWNDSQCHLIQSADFS